MAAKVIPVSLQENLSEYGHDVARELFGNNFSAFVTFLISNYRAGNQIANVHKEESRPTKRSQFDSFLDSIDNHFSNR